MSVHVPPASRPSHRNHPPSSLDGDNEQLSPLSQRVSPDHTSVHIGGVDEQDEYEHQPDAIPYGEEDEDVTATDAASSAEISQFPRVDMQNDPSHSGEFDATLPAGCLPRTWRSILNFPALSTIFPITFVISIFSTFINVVAAPNAFASLADPSQVSFMPSPAGFAISFITTVFLVILALLATRQLLYQLFQGTIKPMQIVGLYLATILLYGDLYLTCAFMDPTSFVFEQGAGSNATTNVVSIWVAFQYLSVSTITCTGYGDIYPALAGPKIIACTELMISIFYHIGIFAIGLEHFQHGAAAEADGTAPPVTQAETMTARARAELKNLRAKYPRLDALRKWFVKYVFFCSLFLQLVFLLILHIFDGNMFNTPDRSADTLIIFIFFCAQIFQFILILLMTLALVRQINKSAVSPGFLIQSWLATVSLFCGLYVLIYLLVPGFQAFHLWNGVSALPGAQHAVVDGQTYNPIVIPHTRVPNFPFIARVMLIECCCRVCGRLFFCFFSGLGTNLVFFSENDNPRYWGCVYSPYCSSIVSMCTNDYQCTLSVFIRKGTCSRCNWLLSCFTFIVSHAGVLSMYVCHCIL
jgi:hypothetical protein